MFRFAGPWVLALVPFVLAATWLLFRRKRMGGARHSTT